MTAPISVSRTRATKFRASIGRVDYLHFVRKINLRRSRPATPCSVSRLHRPNCTEFRVPPFVAYKKSLLKKKKIYSRVACASPRASTYIPIVDSSDNTLLRCTRRDRHWHGSSHASRTLYRPSISERIEAIKDSR